MIERIGWRAGFYISGAAILVAAGGSWFTLPKIENEGERLRIVDYLKRMGKEIDWVGATIASAGLALLSYVLA